MNQKRLLSGNAQEMCLVDRDNKWEKQTLSHSFSHLYLPQTQRDLLHLHTDLYNPDKVGFLII